MYGYDGGIKIEISIPQGVELAKKHLIRDLELKAVFLFWEQVESWSR